MWRAVIVGFSLSLLLAAAPRAEAQFYRYTDDAGQNHYADGLEKIPDRYRGTAVPLQMRNTPPSSPSSAPVPAVKPAGSTVIKYTPGQRIMVDVRINGAFTAQLLLDTGADRTMISPRTLLAAGVAVTRPVGTGSITGVTGSDRISYVVVDSLEIGDARVGRMPVGSYELAGSGAGDGLLGRDFLDQFKMTIDAGQGEVHLTPK